MHLQFGVDEELSQEMLFTLSIVLIKVNIYALYEMQEFKISWLQSLVSNLISIILL